MSHLHVQLGLSVQNGVVSDAGDTTGMAGTRTSSISKEIKGP